MKVPLKPSVQGIELSYLRKDSLGTQYTKEHSDQSEQVM